MDKVELYYGTENGKSGIGIKIHSQEANVDDLLQAWQPLCDDSGLFKLYAASNYSECKGCSVNCCNTAYVIPDLISFRKMARHLNLEYSDFIDRFFQKEKLELGLLRMRPNPCIFLKENICSIYALRSLICRFYICSYILGDTEQLIYSIAWTGITATQLFAEAKGLLHINSEAGSSSFDLLFKKLINDYRDHPGVALFMNAREYKDIPLSVFKL
ncbi:MAG: YkgJ family cysteine cluster protein [Syntrophomonadaceae bacterium]|nr:YkgJ family cysteine cluster protein [Syntrophomonadaceae bacterium]MDD3023162.1 YkgJ family cysteine cluster protein [Syntrophomonadaceae bacterium]